MKRNKITFVFTGCLVAVSAVVFACSSCNRTGNRQDDIEVLDGNLIKSKQAFDQARSTRDQSAVRFAIQKVTRQNGSLNIQVRGGCAADNFKLIWDGYVMESYPAHIRMILVHDPPVSDCDQGQEFVITVDLQKMIGDEANSPHYTFDILNGSVPEGEPIHPNEKNSDGKEDILRQ